MDNCIGCEHLQRMDEDCYGEHKPYYCSKHLRLLKHRYTDTEYPLVESCAECKASCQDDIHANICGKQVTIDTHDWVLDEVITYCTVEILKCRKCGELSIGWKRGEHESV